MNAFRQRLQILGVCKNINFLTTYANMSLRAVFAKQSSDCRNLPLCHEEDYFVAQNAPRNDIRVVTLFRSLILVGLFFGGLSLVACADTETPDPELQAKIDSFAQTVTARADQKGEMGEIAGTVQAESTGTKQALEATQTVAATVDEAAAKATATAMAPIVAELPFYDVDSSLGQVGFIHPPLTLELDSYREVDYANQYPMVIARDFVFASDITWNTQYGRSGCGLIFRADGNPDTGDLYMVIVTRGANGHIIFMAMAKGKLGYVKDFYANRLDPSFAWENDGTNRLTIVGRGNIISIYSNRNPIGEIDTTTDPPVPNLPSKPERPKNESDREAMDRFEAAMQEYRETVDRIQERYQKAISNYLNADTVFDEGFVGMVVMSESGFSQCNYSNTWLWMIEE